MSSTNRPLPPAAEASYRILAEHGPLAASELRERIRPQGFALPVERLQQLSDRFPHRFHTTPDGLLTIATATSENEPDQPETRSDDENWYRPQPDRPEPGRIAVLDIETTGLNRTHDFITEVALVRLDGTPLLDLTVQLPDGVPRPAMARSEPIPVGDAIAALSRQLENVDLVVLHG